MTPFPAVRTSALLVFLASSTACGPPGPEASDEAVVVTIFPVADLVQRMVGPEVRVLTLLPPRASPATWEATPRQIRALAGASAYVAVGGGLDGWLAGLRDDVGDVPSLILTADMELRAAEHGHGGAEEGHTEDSGDPHVWLDPVLVRDEIVPRLEDFLTRTFPARSGDIRTRADALRDTLTALDAEIRALLRDAPRRSFIATHDAWSYFAARYDLHALGVIYERPGHEPSVRGMAALIDRAREAGIDVLLAEPQLAETGARALAREMGAAIRVVDPLGGPGLPGRESYTDMMRTNAREFARALGQR